MIVDVSYCTKVIKKIILVIAIFIGLFLLYRFSLFFIPFVIAFILSLMIEPIIRFLMRKCKLKRRTSSIIVFIIALAIIIGLVAWGIITLIAESSNLLQGLNGYFDKFSQTFEQITSQFKSNTFHISPEIMQIIEQAGTEVLGNTNEWLKNFLNGLLDFITSIPTIGFYIVITFLALYFFCTDKIYLLDQLEHHLPDLWVKRIIKHIREISKSIGGLIKAEAILVSVTFVVCIIGLYILKFVGFPIEYPLLAALGIGFVDALPIFGSATIMIPWAIIVALNGNITLAVALLVLLLIMGMVRQFLEPRVVSGQIGIHPIFTLIAMYTGFKLIGILGMLIGPIVLIILKNVFASFIDKGVMKCIFGRE